jgi:hypothetical protein
LKELGLLGQQEVLNPEFLSRGLYNLPANWANPLDARPATEILGISAKHTETLLTPESLPQPSATSSESKPSSKNLKEKKQPEAAVQIAQGEKLTITDLSKVPEGMHWVKPGLITLDAGTQCRLETDQARVNHYSQLMSNGLWDWDLDDAKVSLIWDVGNQQLLPSDGHHRTEAAMKADQLVLATIQNGDLDLAKALSVGSNTRVGLPKTKDDNRKTVEMMQQLIDERGEDWMLQIINSKLPEDRKFDKLSLRAKEVYTGIPFSTIRNIEKTKKGKDKDKEKTEKIAFTPTPDEMQLIESIMEAEELEKPSEVIRWLLHNYQES